jgi:hypothetical protein
MSFVVSVECSDREYLTIEERAKLLRVKYKTLAIWRHKKWGPPYVKVGKKNIAYRKSDLNEYMAQNTKLRT